MPQTLWVAGSAFAALAFAFTLFASVVVKRTGIVDAPDDERKTQSVPVPRLGGVAILIGTIAGFIAGFFILFVSSGRGISTGFSDLYTQSLILLRGEEPAFVCVAVAFLVGLWDDLATANTKLKLIFLALACLGAAAMGVAPTALNFPGGALTLPAILVAGSAAWMLVFTNAVNFMDGSDGLAVGCLTIMFIGLAAASTIAGDWGLSVWWFALLGAMIAFLLQNMRGALYVGDAGALGLGALFAALGVRSGLDVWTIATFALPFLVDVLLTLVWRAKHGRNWLEPHLDHAYQRLRLAGWSHLETAVLYWGLSAACAAAAYIGARAGGMAPFGIFWGLGLAGISLWVLHRRSAKSLD